jgi:hypothetical protein
MRGWLLRQYGGAIQDSGYELGVRFDGDNRLQC